MLQGCGVMCGQLVNGRVMKEKVRARVKDNGRGK